MNNNTFFLPWPKYVVGILIRIPTIKFKSCSELFIRTSETRVIACGTRGNMIIQTIINQGELNQDLLQLNTERIVSGNLQVLKLKEIKAVAPIPAPSDLVIVKNMMYEYTFKSYQQNQPEIELEQNPSRIPTEVLQEPEV